MGNDCWNMGQSVNLDDNLTFSLNSLYSNGPLGVRVDAWAVTNRGAKDPDSGDFRHGRYDRIDVKGSWNFRANLSKDFSVSFEPVLGITAVGTLAMEEAQNFVHQIMSLYPVYLPHDFDEPSVYPYVGMTLSATKKISHVGSHIIDATARFGTGNAVFFESNHEGALEFSLRDRETGIRTLYAFAGFSLSNPFSEKFTQSLYTEKLSGFQYGYGISAGFLCIDFSRSVRNDFGYCFVSADFMSLCRERRFKEEDFSFRTGRIRLLDKNFEHNSLSVPLRGGFSAVLKMHCTAGSPSLGTQENGITTVRFKRNYSMNSACVRYSKGFFRENLLSVYAEAGFGVSFWKYWRQFNMDPSAEDDRSEYSRKTLFFVNAEAGIEILPDWFFIADRARYKMLLFGGVHFFPDSKAVEKICVEDDSKSPGYDFSGFAPYFGFGVHVSIDI